MVERDPIQIKITVPSEDLLERIYAVIRDRCETSFEGNILTVTERLNEKPNLLGLSSGQVIQHLEARIKYNNL